MGVSYRPRQQDIGATPQPFEAFDELLFSFQILHALSLHPGPSFSPIIDNIQPDLSAQIRTSPSNMNIFTTVPSGRFQILLV